MYSGLERRWKNALVNDYIRSQLVAHEDSCVTHKRGREISCKIDYEQSPCEAFEGSFHSFGFTHQPHEHVILFLHMYDKMSIQ